MRATWCRLVSSFIRLAALGAIVVAVAIAPGEWRCRAVRADDKPPQAKPLAADSTTTKQPPAAGVNAAKTIGLTISGVAKDSAGKPIAGAKINLCVGMKRKMIATMLCDNAGRYEFKDLQLPLYAASGSREETYAGGFSLYGTAAGYGFAWSGSRTLWDKAKPKDLGIVAGDWRRRAGGIDFYRDEPIVVDLEFTRAASLNGHVIDEDDRPVATAKISLWDADYLNGEGKALHLNDREFLGMTEFLKEQVVARSDTEGRFEIGGLPAEVCFGVSVESPGYGHLSFYAATTNRPITVHHFNQSATTIRNNIQVEVASPDSHEVRTGDLTILLHRVRNVLIDVVEGDTGAPAPRVTVETGVLLGSGISAYGKTDGNGRVVLKLPGGQYKLVADPPRDSLYVRTRATLDGTAERDKEPFTIRLVKGCVVNFEALDSESGKGIEGIGFQAEEVTPVPPYRPVPPGHSVLVQTTTGYVDHPTTDKSGRMRAVMQPGNYKFIATPQWLGRRNVGDEYESAIGPGPTRLPSGEEIEVNFRLKRKPAAAKPVSEPSSQSQPADSKPVIDVANQAVQSSNPKPSVADGAAPKASGSDGDARIAKEARTFELTVVGPDGKPLPGISVECRGRPKLKKEQITTGEFVRATSFGSFVRTDSQGRIELKLPAKMERLDFFIESPGYAPYWAGWESETFPETIPPALTAELDPAWSVGGVVVDDEGKPVQGATLRPSIEFKKRPGDTKQLSTGKEAKTDAEGKWHFDCVPVSMPDVHFEIHHPQFKPVWRTLTRAEFGIAPGAAPTAKITLDPGLTVSGTVTDESGAPIAGARIRAKFSNDIREAKTAADGTYKLTGCDHITARIVAWAKGRATDMQELRIEPDMKPVDFHMQPGGPIRVRVVDSQGKPVPKARIFFQRWRGDLFEYFEFDIVSQYADQHGIWEWKEAPLDEFKADICPRGDEAMPLSRQSLIARPEEYVFKLPPRLAISGKVIDAATKKPVESFQVIWGIRSEDSHMTWVRSRIRTAHDGKYELRPSYDYPANLVRIEADGYLPAVSRDVKNDEGNVAIDFELKKGQNLAATVLTPDGAPAAKAKVALGLAGSQIGLKNGDLDDGSTLCERRTTDEAGRFSFPPQDGDYELVITHPAGYARIASSSDKLRSTIKLTPWARIEGTFHVGQKIGANVPITINLQESHGGGKKAPNIFSFYDVMTGPDGRFVFERVVPGRGWIGRRIMLTVNDGAADVTSSCMTRVDLPAGETVRLNLGGTGRAVVGRLRPPENFEGRVPWNFALVNLQVDSNSPRYAAPVPGPNPAVQARLTDELTRILSVTATVDRDGRFRIDDMPEGDYLASVYFERRDGNPGSLSNYHIRVPPSDGKAAEPPINLGTIQLK